MSVKSHDYYDTLGLSREASPEDIQGAYRKLARKYHPDVNKAPEAEDKFKELSEAYEVLKDPEKRKRYDTLGANWQAGQDFQPPPGFEDLFGSFMGGAAHGAGRGARQATSFSFGGSGGAHSDFFDMLFGGASPFQGAGGAGGSWQDIRGATRQRQGQSHEAELPVSLEDAYRGVTKTISLRDPNTGQTRSYQVKVPQGVGDGTTIRMSGQGASGVGGGPAGDLLLKVRITPHPKFRLAGRDILFTLPISPWEAATGATITIPTLGGDVTLKIPAGSQSGQQLKLSGKGLPGKKTKQGNMLAQLKIVVPKKLSKKEKQLFEQLSEVSKFNPRK